MHDFRYVTKNEAKPIKEELYQLLIRFSHGNCKLVGARSRSSAASITKQFFLDFLNSCAFLKRLTAKTTPWKCSL